MRNASLVKKALKPFALVFGSAMGLGWLSENIFSGDDSAANKLGIGGKVLKSFLGVAENVLGEQFGGLIEKLQDSFGYGQQEQLETAIKTAYKESLDQTRKDFAASFSIRDDRALEQLNFFTDDVLDVLSNDDQVGELLQQHQQLDAAGYIRELFNTKTISFPIVIEQDRSVVRDFFVEGFKKYFLKYFSEQLKIDDKAKTTYFKHLIESVIINTKDINTHFSALRSIADQTGVSLQEIIEELNVINSNIAEIQENIVLLQNRLQDHLMQMQEQLQSLKEFTAKNAEPYLDHNIIEKDDSSPHPENRFDYRTQFTHFIGRHNEKYQLWKFLEGDEPFAWWMITGPGGMGKSRLAQEFCALVREEGYHAGFYNLVNGEAKDIHVWEKWQFRYPTLLVVDYALSKISDVQELIATLYKKCQQEKHKPVRILLLERETTREWKDAVKRTEVNISLYRLVDSKIITLVLPGFDESYCWQIIAQAYTESGRGTPINRKAIIDKLRELDPQERPLYAFFVGVALAEGENIRDWNVTNLLDYHLNRLERQVWGKVPAFATHKTDIKNLLLINTLTRGLNVKEVNKLLVDIDLKGTITHQAYSFLSDIGVNEQKETEWRGILPDILGEYFILKHLNDLMDDWEQGEEKTIELLRIAWELKPGSTWWMSSLCIYDFYRDFDVSIGLIKSDDLILSLSNNAAYYSCFLLCNIIIELGGCEIGKKIADDAYKTLQKLAVHKQEDHYRILQAQAAYNLITHYGKIESLWEPADILYKELEHLANEHQLDEIWIEQANAANNLIGYYGSVETFRERAEFLHLELTLLASDHSLPEIWKAQAMATNNLISLYGGVESLHDSANILYEELKQLASDRKLDEIWKVQALAAYNLIHHYGAVEGLRGKTDELYEELKQLATIRKLDEIWDTQAMAIVKLINYYEQVESLRDSADILYEELKQLADDCQLDTIWIWQSVAVQSLIYYKSEYDQLTSFKLFYELHAMAKEKPLPKIWLNVEYGLAVLLLSFREKLDSNFFEELKRDYYRIYLAFYQHPIWQKDGVDKFIEVMKELGIDATHLTG